MKAKLEGMVVDNSASEEPEPDHEECDPLAELEYEYAQLLLERDRLLLERESEQTDLERLLEPEREIHGLRLVTWVRLGMIALFLWYAL